MTTPLDSPDGHLPEKIGPYRLLDKLGEGASSVVHRAFHEEDPTQPVAIKLTKGLWTEADIETVSASSTRPTCCRACPTKTSSNCAVSACTAASFTW
ncbi:MAG: hypothetical protein IPP09_05760 [Elusimicrobia bacterium]|nr:hypothetical protein [Elusimicrobiota bacterium]